ncbi:MAG: response regulator transcription factor [Rhodobiaceae bacterium]|nr:response regulator transcription factor [Rhodobiaceae bacterium]MCC0055056.1 response regulator transcription factor [Rhodobiaceae bacterium]
MSQELIYLVDDDAAILDALGMVFSIEGFDVRAYQDPATFISDVAALGPAPVILDVHMPGKSGFDVLREIDAQHYPAPIFVISGQGDIPMAVNAIKQGAHDFIEKPFNADHVVSQIREATAVRRERANDPADIDLNGVPGADQLTPREREVVTLITAGASNKEAGRSLGISPRTIEVHRARIMEKLGARNAADLVRIVMARI